jgi:ubiquitin carboxyl-terminal hydrolase 10
VREEVEDDIMESFMPGYVHDALKEKKRFDHMRVSELVLLHFLSPPLSLWAFLVFMRTSQGGHQEDAEEFLGFYLDTLEEELLTLSSSLSPAPAPQNGSATTNSTQEEGWLEVGKRNRTVQTRTVRVIPFLTTEFMLTSFRQIKTADSPITRIFGGKFRSTLRVPHQKDSVVVEDWRSLRLDIQVCFLHPRLPFPEVTVLIQRDTIHTIKDALAHISSPQSVQVTSVTRPGAILDASQQVHIESLPPILILHLKRFLYDANKGGVAKVGKQIAFASELDVGPEVMAAGRKIHGTRYRLFGGAYPIFDPPSCILILSS